MINYWTIDKGQRNTPTIGVRGDRLRKNIAQGNGKVKVRDVALRSIVQSFVYVIMCLVSGGDGQWSDVCVWREDG